MNTAARRIANAMRTAAAREHERRGPGRYRATVLTADPLKLDVHGSDLELDGDDVTISKHVTDGGGIDDGDVVALLEVDRDEYLLVAVEEDA